MSVGTARPTPDVMASIITPWSRRIAQGLPLAHQPSSTNCREPIRCSRDSRTFWLKFGGASSAQRCAPPLLYAEVLAIVIQVTCGIEIGEVARLLASHDVLSTAAAASLFCDASHSFVSWRPYILGGQICEGRAAVRVLHEKSSTRHDSIGVVNTDDHRDHLFLIDLIQRKTLPCKN